MSSPVFDIEVTFNNHTYQLHVKRVPEPDEELRFQISDDEKIIGDIWQQEGDEWHSDRIKDERFVNALGGKINQTLQG